MSQKSKDWRERLLERHIAERKRELADPNSVMGRWLKARQKMREEETMTDRLTGVFVVFEEDLREDDAEPIIDAIKQIRGVLGVESQVSDMTNWAAEARVRQKLTRELWSVLHPKKGSENAT